MMIHHDDSSLYATFIIQQHFVCTTKSSHNQNKFDFRSDVYLLYLVLREREQSFLLEPKALGS